MHCKIHQKEPSLLLKNGRRFEVGHSEFIFTNTIDEVADYWKEFAYEDLFFSPAFLKVIETSPELGIKPFYVLQMQDGLCKGIFYFQLKYFKLKESLSKKNESGLSIKSALQGLVNFNTLVFGNLLLTGNYGCCNVRDAQHNFDWKNFQDQLLGILKDHYQFEPSAILAKDFYDDQIPSHLAGSGFSSFSVQPNMEFYIRENWKSFDDYLEDLKAKYRVRYRRALKKADGLHFKALNESDLVVHQDLMHRLYTNIADNAAFNLFQLPPDYFVKMKQALGDNFIVHGCFDEQGQMLAFYSCVNNKDHLQAHFLGYNLEKNEEKQIYLNMLYRMIELGITLKQSKIILSRTAIEIKSSVGAVPMEMSCMFMHTNAIANRFFGPLFSLYNPTPEEYVIRSPFKE